MRRYISGICLKTPSLFFVMALVSFGLCAFGGQVSAASPGDVIINEFVPRPSGGTEWVELQGVVSSTFDLTGWTIESIRMEMGYATRTITLSGTLPDHGILVFTDTAKLDDAGAIVTLKDNLGNMIYNLSYGDQDLPGPGEPHLALPDVGASAYFDAQAMSWSASSTPFTYGWFNGPPAPTLASIVAQINANGIETNLGSAPNPSAASGIYFSTSTGRITYSAVINYTDYYTKVVLEDIGSKMSFANAFVGFDAQTSAQLKDLGATIQMYNMTGLGYTSQPYIQVATDLGVIIPSTSSTYPALTGLSFDSGTFSFNASHFTEFGAYKVLNQTTGQGYNTIQEAVGAANFGDSIAVSGGTYNEDVTVATSVTITGSGSPSVTKLTFASSTISVSGLTATTTAVSSTGRIVDAVGAVASGGTVLLDNADYGETVTLNKSLTMTGQGAGMTTTTKFVLTANPITITGVDVPTLDVSGSGKIADAANAIGTSGTINVAAGTYAENVTLARPVAINGTGSPVVNKFILNSQPVYCSGITANVVDVGSGGSIANGVACVTGGGTLNVLGAQNYGESVTVGKGLTITGPGAGTATTTKLTFTANPVTVSGLDVPTIDVSGSGLIANAVAAVQAGGTVNVSAGVHAEAVTINKAVSLAGSGSSVTSFTLATSPISIAGVSSGLVYVQSGGKVQDAVNLVNAGGTVRLAAGTYTENVVIAKTVDLGGGGNHPIIAASNVNDHTITVAANNVILGDITARGATGVGKAAVYIEGFDSLDFTSGGARDSYYGFVASSSNANYFRYSTASGNTDAGLLFVNSVSGTVSMGNLISNAYGANIVGGSSGINIYENTISGNTTLGVQSVTSTSASRNWWGHASGPSNATYNASGTGNGVSDLVTFRPFYTDVTRTTLSSQSVDAADIGTLIDQGVFQIPSGYPSTSTPSVTVLEDVTINAGGNQVIIPAGTVITQNGGGNFDATQLAAAAVTASLASGLTGSVVDGVMQWGITGLGLEFNPAITLKINVGTGLNGTTLNIQRSSSLTAGWTTDGLGSASCVVASGICTFTTTKASYFGSSHTPVTSGGGGGGGGVGGSTYIAYTPVYQSYTRDADRENNIQNLALIGVEPHWLVKLPDDGDANTQEDTAVYYIGADGRRHAFPNDKAYFTWYSDFSGVKVLTADKLASIPLGANVRYRSGVRMVKFTTDPKVYAVSLGGQLRWIKTEELAKALYGHDWNTKIDDLSDAFYVNYSFGEPIEVASEFNPSAQTSGADKISTDLGL